MSVEIAAKKPPKGLDKGYIDAAAAIGEIVQHDLKEKTEASHLLRALCLLTSKLNLEEEAEFTTAELIDAMREHRISRADALHQDQENQSEFINRHWKTLNSKWKEKEEGVNQKLRARGIFFEVTLGKKPGGGKGHQSRYFLEFEKSAEPHQKKIPPGGVEYITNEKSDDKRDQWYFKLLLTGWAAGIWVAVFISLWVCFIGLLLLSFLAILSDPELAGLISIGVVAIAGFLVFRPFTKLIEDRVVLAPWWLQGWWRDNTEDRLIELRRDEIEQANAVHLTRYSAYCPQCFQSELKLKSSLKICSGRREFHYRLIGRCIRSPNEHVYSFDHFLRVGKPLR